MDDQKMKVCYITDEKYAMPTYVSMFSLKENITTSTVVYVICISVSDESKIYFKNLKNDTFNVEIIDADNVLPDVEDIVKELKDKTGTHVSKSALVKFDLPDVFNDINKILYLDGDVIVNKDISELWKTDINGYYVAASDDMGNGKFLGENYPDLASQIGLSNDDYFNSGVLVLNLELMRNNGVSEVLKKYRKEGTNYFMDQDALNAVLGTKRKRLLFEYNYMMTMTYQTDFEKYNELFYEGRYKSLKECLEDQFIIHMAGRYKPWEYLMPYASNIFDRYYFRGSYGRIILCRKEFSAQLYSDYLSVLKRLGDVCQELGRVYQEQEYLYKCKEVMDWHFPRERIPRNSRIVLYGAGAVGKAFAGQIQQDNYCRIALWVDGSYKGISGYDISSPEKIPDVIYDYVLIALSRQKDIEDVKDYLSRLGCPDEKVLTIFSE